MLQVRVEVATEQELTVSLQGEDHTILNVLVEELNKDPRVEMAAYEQAHPLTGEYRLTVKTRDEASPLEALRTACERLKKIYENLLEQVDAQRPL